MCEETIKKACYECGQEKKLSEFPKAKTCRDGRANKCNLCRSSEIRHWRDENSGKEKETKRLYYINHIEEIKETRRQYRHNNKEKERLRHAEYHLKNKSIINTKRRETFAIFSKKVVLFMGGTCQLCGLKTDYYEVYDCHHRDPREKEYSISLLSHKDWEAEVLPELQKCILVCRRCHVSLTRQIARLKLDKTPDQKYNNCKSDAYKKRCVDYIGNRCQICNFVTEDYAKYDFHHVSPPNKSYGIPVLLRKDWDTIVKPELDKCALLCGNCHRSLHYGRYNDLVLIPGPLGVNLDEVVTFDQVDTRQYLLAHQELLYR
jgi:hypothetical protein